MPSNFGRDLTHLVVLAVLVVVLLVVLTKFQWIHCSQIPGWCNIYCDVIVRSHSQVAILYGGEGDGIGNPYIDAAHPGSLEERIRSLRPDIALVPIPVADLSFGLLRRYDVVILERAKNVTSRQTRVLADYLERGGTLVLVGDSATVHAIDAYDVLEAEQKNASFYRELSRNLIIRNETWDSAYAKESIKRWQESVSFDILNDSSRVRTGFRLLKSAVAADYNKTVYRSRGHFANLTIVRPDHLVAKGLVRTLTNTFIQEYAVVHVDPSAADVLAFLEDGADRYPGILETRFAGRVIYFAFPPERVNSNTLLTNMWDYIAACSGTPFAPDRSAEESENRD